MDILKVLAYNNDKTVRETVVSSFLNYFLDPQGDHGLGSALLEKYLSNIGREVPVIDDTVIGLIQSHARSEEISISVASEWGGVSSTSDKGRRLDSLIIVKLGKRVLLLGTEIKIYGKSSQDKDQLRAYINMLAEFKELIAEEDELALEDIYPVLCYLIPGDSDKGYQFALDSAEECRSRGVDGIVVLNWKKEESDIGKPKNARVALDSMEAMILSVIRDYQDGSISPADAKAIDLLRSLRNAAISRFNFFPPINRKAGRFPTNAQYEESLSEYQRNLLYTFRKAATIVGISRPLTANTRHTTIGIPAVKNPPKGENNSLCQIVTVTSYVEEIPASTFILQLSKGRYESAVKRIEQFLGNAPFPIEMLMEAKNGKPLYHQNGKSDEEVYLITFPEQDSPEIIEEICPYFQSLIKTLKEIFLHR